MLVSSSQSAVLSSHLDQRWDKPALKRLNMQRGTQAHLFPSYTRTDTNTRSHVHTNTPYEGPPCEITSKPGLTGSAGPLLNCSEDYITLE